MFYQLQIFLIVALLLLGTYELFQLNRWGKVWVNSSRSLIKRIYSFVLPKKTFRSLYKYQ